MASLTQALAGVPKSRPTDLLPASVSRMRPCTKETGHETFGDLSEAHTARLRSLPECVELHRQVPDQFDTDLTNGLTRLTVLRSEIPHTDGASLPLPIFCWKDADF